MEIMESLKYNASSLAFIGIFIVIGVGVWYLDKKYPVKKDDEYDKK